MGDYIKNKEEYDRLVKDARRADIWAFLHDHHPDSFKEEGSTWLRMKADKSVIMRRDWSGAVDKAGKRGRGGSMNSIELLTELLSYSFMEAVRALQPYVDTGAVTLSGSVRDPSRDFSKPSEPSRKIPRNPAPLPSPIANYDGVIRSYLCDKRGIPESVVDAVISENLAYLADAREVFKVKGRVIVFRNYAGTFAIARAVARMFNGAKYRMYSKSPTEFWHWQPNKNNKPDTVYVCESVIDVLSLYALLPPDLTLSAVLCAVGGATMYSRIDRVIAVAEKGSMRVVMAMDADDAGDACSEKYAGLSIRLRPPDGVKDWNDTLILRKKDS